MPNHKVQSSQRGEDRFAPLLASRVRTTKGFLCATGCCCVAVALLFLVGLCVRVGMVVCFGRSSGR